MVLFYIYIEKYCANSVYLFKALFSNYNAIKTRFLELISDNIIKIYSCNLKNNFVKSKNYERFEKIVECYVSYFNESDFPEGLISNYKIQLCLIFLSCNPKYNLDVFVYYNILEKYKIKS